MIYDLIKELVKEYAKSPYDINNGECEDFAIEIIKRMGGYSQDLTDGAPDVMEYELPGHYWIEYKGKYYDAECPSGACDWRKLPIFQRYFNGNPELLEYKLVSCTSVSPEGEMRTASRDNALLTGSIKTEPEQLNRAC